MKERAAKSESSQAEAAATARKPVFAWSGLLLLLMSLAAVLLAGCNGGGGGGG